jgi:hypothetical protein
MRRGIQKHLPYYVRSAKKGSLTFNSSLKGVTRAPQTVAEDLCKLARLMTSKLFNCLGVAWLREEAACFNIQHPLFCIQREDLLTHPDRSDVISACGSTDEESGTLMLTTVTHTPPNGLKSVLGPKVLHLLHRQIVTRITFTRLKRCKLP